ncbi:MAG: hypothetical protein ACK59M_10490 [Pseudomonadota bacterium]|jgi:hypothetical protein
MVNEISEISAGLASDDEKRRWSAAVAAGELIATQPDVVWRLVLAHGSSPSEDLRMAIATCVLEHLLEHHFEVYFPLIEAEVRSGNALLRDTLGMCWKFGQAECPANARRWDELLGANTQC